MLHMKQKATLKRQKTYKHHKTKKIGNRAEDLACLLLTNTGHTIISRNFYKKVGEIDIISTKEGVYHFIEVKGVTYETPWDVSHQVEPIFRVEERVTKSKIHKIYKTASLFMLEQGIVPPVEAQIDLVTVCFYKSGDIPRLDIIENIE
jgi:Holliday junction resolvase-like predicted endonuclease